MLLRAAETPLAVYCTPCGGQCHRFPEVGTCLHAGLGHVLTHGVVLAAARAEQLALCGEKEAPVEWLRQVSQPMKDVMSAMQHMASVGVQANIQKDSSHSAVMQSMTPDALLACGKRCWMASLLCCCL